MSDKELPPPVKVSETELDSSGFTATGKSRFLETVNDYTKLLFDKSIHHGDLQKDSSMAREVTHNNVKTSAYSIANSFGVPQRPTWSIWTQGLEYIFTLIAGGGVGNIDKPEGIIAFVGGAAIALLLFILRMTKAKVE